MDSTDVVVVGAGVIGLAAARALAAQGLDTLVLERNERPGQETSSRNSGVIHSGLYYQPGSLKAKLCVRGREMLYDYCLARGVAHRRCGKIVVASKAQLAALEALLARGLGNGVSDLSLLTAQQVKELEPQVSCAAGLLSPSTGIIDVHEYLLALIADLEACGGAVVLRCPVQQVEAASNAFVVTAGDTALRCRWLVNCAGLSAVDFLGLIRGYPANLLRSPLYAKGTYFACHGARPFQRLVYPMPNEAGLGVHATLDLDGTTRFGPDVEWVSNLNYDVDAARVASFYEAVREYWPAIPTGCLQPAYAGIRPKLVGPGQPAGDFLIETAQQHGLEGLINLLGIESPGLTSSLALAEEVAQIVATAA